MKTTLRWAPATLREHAGECLLLGRGDVALVYELCGADRARVAFYLFRYGSFRLCVVDTGSVQALLKILNRHENTEGFMSSHGFASVVEQG